jgi:hypothetical protein
MRKVHLVWVALAAILVVGVMTAASASALEFLLAEWLVNGAPITTELSAATEGELLLEETVLGIKLDALCSVRLAVRLGIFGFEIISIEWESLEGTKIGTELVEPGIPCVNDGNCPEPLAWADKLPWKGELELMEDTGGPFFVELLLDSGYHIVCMGSGTSDLCESAVSAAKVTNEAGGVLDAEFSESFTELTGLELGNCNTAGAKTGIVEGLGTTKLLETGTLTVSSEG